MPQRIDVPINEDYNICDDLGCESEYLQLSIYNDKILICHNEPLTPWKANFNEILLLGRYDAIHLARALLKAADHMSEVLDVYDGM